MRELVFFIISLLFSITFGITDGLFNRLVFKQQRKLGYKTKEKQEVYDLPEWRWIGLVFLILMPVIFPVAIAFVLGGIHYVLLYLVALLVVPWDIIFGKLVFDDWFGDTPSIALPAIGWLHSSLTLVLIARAISAILAFVIYLNT